MKKTNFPIIAIVTTEGTCIYNEGTNYHRFTGDLNDIPDNNAELFDFFEGLVNERHERITAVEIILDTGEKFKYERD